MQNKNLLLLISAALLVASQTESVSIYHSMRQGIPTNTSSFHRSQAKRRKLNRIRWSN